MQSQFTICQCGCGTIIPALTKLKKPARFKHGHNGNAPLEERFWAKVDKTNDCWIWTGSRDQRGYGRIKNGGNKLASRISWEMHFSPIPPGMFVCHHCDNPPCVRPNHLFLGTQQDNMQDMRAKHRGGDSALHGASHHQAKLTEQEVLLIRQFRRGIDNVVAFAVQFNISKSQVYAISRGASWKYLRRPAASHSRP